MTPWLALAISLVFTVIALIFMRRMIERKTAATAVLDEVRREIGAILTEMNQTTERNIELIEDRLQTLQATMEQADRKVGVLRRETARRTESENVYAQLGRSKSVLVSAGTEASAAEPEAQPATVQTIVEPEPPQSQNDVEIEPPSMKQRVLSMYRQGIPLERIASRLGTAVSEIELIVSLSERQ